MINLFLQLRNQGSSLSRSKFQILALIIQIPGMWVLIEHFFSNLCPKLLSKFSFYEIHEFGQVSKYFNFMISFSIYVLEHLMTMNIIICMILNLDFIYVGIL